MNIERPADSISFFTNDGLPEKWKWQSFTSAMLEVIEHCAMEAKIDVEMREVCVGDMRDAYDLLTRKLARDSAEPAVQAKSVLITMALDDNISALQELLGGRAPDIQIAEKLEMILAMIRHLKEADE